MPDTTDGRTWRATDITLTDEGKLHIPSEIRERADIEPGDVIDVDVIPEDDDADAALCLDLIVRPGNYVTIPDYKRTVHNIKTDSTVSADIRRTGRSVDLE